MTQGRSAPSRVRSRGNVVAQLVTELSRHRALLQALLSRHVRARYRGSTLGFLWTFLNPLLLVGVYALVFRFYMRIDAPNYAVMLLAGLLPWLWFNSSLSEGSNAIIAGGALVTKSLFPTEILPTVVVLNHLVNFLFGVPILLLVGLAYGIVPHIGFLVLLLPLALALQLTFTLGLTLAVAGLNVHYRDVQHILTSLLLLWFFLCPIVYPASMVPPELEIILLLNPMALLTELYQAIFVTHLLPSPTTFAVLVLDAGVSLVAGATIFDRYRDSFAELV